MSVYQSSCPPVVITIASERKEQRTYGLENRLILATLVLVWTITIVKIWYLPYKSNRYMGSLAHGKSDPHQI